MRKYKLKELRELVRLGVAEDYTNKPSEYIYTLRRLEKVGYSTGVYGINGGLVKDTKPDNLDNLESYLSRHFPEWVSRWANSPEDLAAEMKEFARMEI